VTASVAGRLLAWLAANSLALGFVGVFTTVYSVLAIRRQITVHTGGYDLGIFEQAIRNYAALRPPIAVLKGQGFNLLGDHFHPILATLAPFYAVFPTPITLLVAQAFLFALAAWPLVNWARRSLGSRAAVAIGLVYGLSFGIASAVGFDFHEIAFAVPLLAFSLSALGQGRLGHAAAWALPLVFVKEDLGVTAVAVIGLLIAWRGARRLGIVTAAIGIVATIVEMTVLLPLVNSSSGYDYWNRIDSGRPLLTVIASSPELKLSTLLFTVAMTGFVALFSPLALVAVPTLVWRFIGDDSSYWGTGYHYSAVLMPILVAAMIDALVRWKKRGGWRAGWGSRSAMILALAVTVALIPSHAFSQFFRPTLWQPNPRISAIDEAIARIPNGATVSASDDLVPQLTSRATVTLFGLAPLDSWRPSWILVDPHSTRHYHVSRAAEHRDLVRAEADGYAVVLNRDGITLLRNIR
jgi:uncharacterized membrane protein